MEGVTSLESEEYVSLAKSDAQIDKRREDTFQGKVGLSLSSLLSKSLEIIIRLIIR